MANEQEQKDLLKRIEWAFQNRDKISSFITVHKDSFDTIMQGFTKGYDHHIHNHEQIVKIFDSLRIPSAEEINSGHRITFPPLPSVEGKFSVTSEELDGIVEHCNKAREERDSTGQLITWDDLVDTIPKKFLPRGSSAYHDGLLARIKWADQNYDLVIKVYASSITHDSSLQENIDYFNQIRSEYKAGNGFPFNKHLRIHEVLNALGIPSLTMVDDERPFTKRLEVRGQAFADTVYKLKASVECAGVVEAKIQQELTNNCIELVRDIHGVTSFSWYAVIYPKEPLNTLMHHLREVFWTATPEEMKVNFDELSETAAHGYIWLGYEDSPEVALTAAMVDFRRDQLRQLGLHA
jgi:hypothetical protein